MIIHVKIKRKNDDPQRGCPFRSTCVGACERCETHSYSEACVPLLQSRCNLLGERWLAAENEVRRLRGMVDFYR